MNVIALFESEFCVRLTETMLHFLWQGLAIALLVALINHCLLRASANVRYALNTGALAIMALCLPVTFSLMTAQHLDNSTGLESAISHSLTQPHVTPTGSLIDTPDEVRLPPVSEASGSHQESADHSVPRPVQRAATPTVANVVLPWLAPFATCAYFIGLSIMLMKFSVSMWGGHRLRIESTPVSDAKVLEILRRQSRRLHLQVEPTLAVCQRISVPIVIGIIKPVILLPVSLASSLSPQQLEALLTHELAHIRRYDLAVNMFQRLIEAGLFFHPAVWYVSRRMHIERELACDDFVISAGWQKIEYANALVRMAELCATSAHAGTGTLAASGNDSSQFKLRIERLLNAGETPRVRLRRSGMLIMAFLAMALLASAVLMPSWANRAVGERPNDSASSEEVVEWGDTASGLRCRAISVSAEMSEDAIKLSESERKFYHPDQVAFAVELENVSNQSIKLLLPSSNWLGQFLFSIEYFDKSGKKIEQPKAELWHLAPYPFNQANKTTLASGEKRLFFARPAKWMSLASLQLDTGDYQAVVHYHGVPSDAVTHFPEFWSGDAASKATEFTIQPPSSDLSSHYAQLVWGETSNGLRAALELRPHKIAYAHGEKPEAKLHVQNVSDDPIPIWTSFQLPEGLMTAINDRGKAVELEQGEILLLGREPFCRVVISPQQTMIVDAGQLHFAPPRPNDGRRDKGGRRFMFAAAGAYMLQFQQSFRHYGSNANDWSGELTTGATPVVVGSGKDDTRDNRAEASSIEQAIAAVERTSPKDSRSNTQFLLDALQAAKEPSKELPAINLDLMHLDRLSDGLWIDKRQKRVVLDAEVCLREGVLEMLACPAGTKEHESVVSIMTQPSFVHAALLAVGGQSGRPVQFGSTYSPASGDRIDVFLLWNERDGTTRQVPAQQWVRYAKTQKAMDSHWVFAGSRFSTDESSGKTSYLGDAGDFICVANFPTATMDLPIESTQRNASLLFEAFTENIPPVGTKLKMVLVPVKRKDVAVENKATSSDKDEAKPQWKESATDAIARGLKWLADTQSADGSWDAANQNNTTAMTGLAGCALLAEGSTATSGEFADAIHRAVEYLIRNQRDNGLLVPTESNRYMFGHGFAMLFLARVLAVEQDADLRTRIVGALNRAVAFTKTAQTDKGGWGYVSAEQGNNFDEGAVTVSQLHALRTCRAAGITLPDSVFKAGFAYLKESTTGDNGVVYSRRGGNSGRPALTAGALTAVFESNELDNEYAIRWRAYCEKHSHFTELDKNQGHWYYAQFYYGQHVRRMRGERWNEYRDKLFPILIAEQGKNGGWEHSNFGPTFATAINLILLQLE